VDVGDNELIAQSVDRDPEAFAHLARRHGRAIHRYLNRRSSHQMADDLLAEVWLRAFQSRRTYDQSWIDARPWLYGIARNTLRAHWRDGRRDIGQFELPHDPWNEVDDGLDARRIRTALQSTLNALRAEDREVLLLVAWEGLTPSEAAITLGIPSGTARWRLHRARRTFRAEFATATAETTSASEPIVTKEI
jgi:RNA polymerase sigma factor (sigma-70 family)